MTPVQQGIVALIIANLIWGAASPIFKLSLTNIPPFTLAFMRFAIATVLIGIFVNRKLHLPVMSRKDSLLFLLYTLSGITLNVFFYFYGLKLTLAMNAPVIISSQPIMTFLFCTIFLHEPFRRKKLAGMLLGTLGMLLILLEPLLEKGMDGSVVGNLALVLATAAAAVATIAGTRVFSRHNPTHLMFWAFLTSAATFLPFAAWELRQSPSLFASLDTRGFMGIAYGAIFSSAIAYTCSSWGLSKIKATDASMFAYVDPVAGTVLAFFLLHEPITLPFLIGSIAIFGGIFIAEGRIHYHPVHRLRHGKE